MLWIKRNLLFVLSAATAVVLMLGAGYYLFTRLQLDKEVTEKLNEQIAELERMYNLPLTPNRSNIDLVQKEQKRIQSHLAEFRKYFQPIEPGAEARVDGPHFKEYLEKAITELHNEARAAGVSLSPRYSFSFEGQRKSLQFPPGSLEPLARQVEEIRTVCKVLLQAKVNSLEGVRRVRVSPEDQPNASEYLSQTSVTNSTIQATLVPYEFSFRCFSSDLANVMEILLRSPHGFLVKLITVEASEAVAFGPRGPPPPGPPPPGRPRVPPGPRPPGPPGPPPGAPPLRGGLRTVLNERSFKVTLLLDVIRLKPGT